jgi:hypothetical protein
MTWRLAVLKSYALCPNGLASNQDIYDKVRQFKALKASHLRPQWGNRPAYHNQVRSHISDLCDSGDLVPVDEGLHRLTAKGTAHAAATP